MPDTGGMIQLCDKAADHHADLTSAQALGMSLFMLIYKLLRAEEWAALQTAGATDGAPIDQSDGYIHFSTSAQVAETAAKYFAGEQGIMLLAYDGDALGDALTWEESRGGALFPHLYRRLKLDEMIWAKPLPAGPDGFEFPQDLA